MEIERILANNPGPFTGPGTNTWVIDDGNGSVVIIDPGPIDNAHRRAIEDRIGHRNVQSVLVTHTHPDHAPMANPLASAFSVPALGHGPGPEFVPDLLLHDQSKVAVGELEMDVIHTPGHADDHLCFRLGNVLFSGDHIIGGSSVMVEKLGPYLRSLEKIRGLGLGRIHPGHGDEMREVDDVIDWYIAHRLQRHAQISDAILAGASTVSDVVEAVYSEIDSSLHPLAKRSVLAHLGLMSEEGRIALTGEEITPLNP